jgi:hypothetical protein
VGLALATAAESHHLRGGPTLPLTVRFKA